MRDLVPLLENQWTKANLPFVPPVIIGHRALEQKTLWKKVQDAANGRGKASERAKMEQSLDKLFDVVQCPHKILLCKAVNSSCNNPSSCKKKVHIFCDCSREKKVPVEELERLRSQRVKVGERGGMQMDIVDQAATKKYDKYLKNEAAAAEPDDKRRKKE